MKCVILILHLILTYSCKITEPGKARFELGEDAVDTSLMNKNSPIISFVGAIGTVEYVGNSMKVTPTTLISNGSDITSCISSPALPAWASLDNTTCTISGTPDSALVSTTYTIKASNNFGTSTDNVTIEVIAPSPPSLSFDGASDTTGTVGSPMNVSPTTLSSNGSAITSCSSSPALPVWASLDNSTCIISGTPAGILSSTSYTITATNGAGSTSASVTLEVSTAPPGISYHFDSGSYRLVTIGHADTISPVILNDNGSSITNCTADTLPVDFTINSTTCVLSYGGNNSLTATDPIQQINITATNAIGSTITTLNLRIGNFYKTKWDTTLAPDTDQITLPTVNGGNYDFKVDWGDGNLDLIKSWDQAEITHTYESGGEYWITIADIASEFAFAPGDTNAQKLIDVASWGDYCFSSYEGMFRGTTHLNSFSETTAPCFTNATSMRAMFDGSSFNQAINTWDVSTITDMSYLFKNNTVFNQDIESWNVSLVTDMSSMFDGARAFNQALNLWGPKLVNVTDMSSMFAFTDEFNQDLNSWNVSNVEDMSGMFAFAIKFNGNITSWNVENVRFFSQMFAYAHAFNQNISTWNPSNVSSFGGMFQYATNFNQPIGEWTWRPRDHAVLEDNISMAYMFNGASQFNQPLGAWNMVGVYDFNNHMFNGASSFDQDISTWTTISLAGAGPIDFDTGTPASWTDAEKPKFFP